MVVTPSIPYMGSKSRLAYSIVQRIRQLYPEAKYFYDLFGGGGAIAIQAASIKYELYLRPFKKVFYNEINKYVYALFKKVITDGLPEYVLVEYVSRDKYYYIISNNNDKYPDWYVGFVKCVWSFRNNGRSYIYGVDVEPYKRALHYLCYFDDNAEAIKLYGNSFVCDVRKQKTPEKRRILMLDRDRSGRKRLQSQTNINRIKEIKRSGIVCTNLDYQDVLIDTPVNETVLYCDIPYQNTCGYNNEEFNYEIFYEWVYKQKCPVFISEYQCPFKEVLAMKHRSTLSAVSVKNTIEKLFLFCP